MPHQSDLTRAPLIGHKGTVKTKWIVLSDADNVATALTGLAPGEAISAASAQVVIAEPIAFGHKFALAEIPAGGKVVKYGESIGTASTDIAPGQHVHIHNLRGQRGRGDLV